MKQSASLRRPSKRKPRRDSTSQTSSVRDHAGAKSKNGIILVDYTRKHQILRNILAKLEIEVVDVAAISEAPSSEINPRGLLCVTDEVSPKLCSEIREARAPGRLGGIPFVVVAENYVSGEAVRELYRAGVTGVLYWPGDALLLPTLLPELLAKIHDSSGLEPMARSIEARVRTALHREVDASVSTDGHVRLRGRAASAKKKLEMKTIASRTPGVSSVDDSAIQTRRRRPDDAALLRQCLERLQRLQEIESRTLAVSVRRGYVRVAGSVGTRQELDRISETLKSIPGVRTVDNLTIVAPRQQERDRERAQKLQRELPHDGLYVSAFGEFAALSGDAKTRDELRQAARTFDKYRDLSRCIDVSLLTHREPVPSTGRPSR